MQLQKLRSARFQKFATASQTLGFEKPSSLRTDSSQPSLRDGTMISKLRGERAQQSKKFNSEQAKSKLHIVNYM